MAETVAVMLGDGFEPVEVVAPVDVCIDKNLITATGPATALPFGRALLEALKSEKDANEVASGMLF